LNHESSAQEVTPLGLKVTATRGAQTLEIHWKMLPNSQLLPVSQLTDSLNCHETYDPLVLGTQDGNQRVMTTPLGQGPYTL
jgi:hypothetical protein